MNRAKGVLFSYLLIVAESLSALFFTPFLIRSLGAAEYGVYSLIISVSAFVMLLDGGAGNAIVRFSAKFNITQNHQRQQNLLAVSLVYYSCVTLLLLPLYFMLASCFPPFFGEGLNGDQISLAITLLALAMAEIGLRLISMAFSKTLLGIERFAVSKIIDITRIALRVGFSVIALLLGYGSVGVLAANLIASCIVLFILAIIVIYWVNLKPKMKGVDKSFVLEVVSYSASVMLLMIATQIIMSSDQILIAALVDNSAIILAVYAVGSVLNQYFQQVANAINGILMPGVVRLVEHNSGSADLQHEITKIGRILFCILGLVWIVFLINGEQFVVLWAGSEYADSYYVALILMVPWGLALMENVGSSVLYALNKHLIQAVLKLAVALLNIILTAVLILWNPLLGATLGTAIAVFVGDVVIMNYVFRKVYGFKPFRYYKDVFHGIFLALVISGVGGYCFSFIGLDGWVGFFANCSVMVLLAISQLWLYGLSSKEKNRIVGFVKKPRQES